MSRVKIVVGGHEVELESDMDFNTMVGKALYLFKETADEAKSLHIGFDATNLITELERGGGSGGTESLSGLCG